MRATLRLLLGQRRKFIGRVNKFSATKDRNPTCSQRPTTLLADVFVFNGDNVEYVGDHIWVRTTRDLDLLLTNKGDIVTFWATVNSYVRQGSCDYGVHDIRNPQFASPNEAIDYKRWEGKIQRQMQVKRAKKNKQRGQYGDYGRQPEVYAGDVDQAAIGVPVRSA